MSTLPRSTPSEQGVDAAGLLAFVEAVEALPGSDLHGLVVLRHGHVVAHGHWAPYTSGRPHHLYSLSKSFTSTALGIAVDEGLVGLDDLVSDHLPDLFETVTDERTRSLRLRHLIAMSTGHLEETWHRALELAPMDPVHGFLALPPDREPGTVFAYNQPATYTVATILQKVTGQTLLAYLRPRLLDPLGVGRVGWLEWPPGRQMGFMGLHASTDDIAALGLLHLQRGVWDGRRLLSEEWVDEATRSHVATPGEPEPDWRCGYGFQFWMSQHGYRGDGAYGQYCVVLPDLDAVVAITGETDHMQGVLDLLWEHALPAFDGAGSTAADAALGDHLAAASLPTCRGSAAPPADDRPWTDGPFVPSATEQASLVGVGLGRDGGDGDGWTLTLTEQVPGEDALDWTVPLGLDGWATSTIGPGATPAPVAVSGGWSDDATLRAEVVFLETPHRLRLTCSLPGRTVEATWSTLPMAPLPLRDLRCPTPS